MKTVALFLALIVVSVMGCSESQEGSQSLYLKVLASGEKAKGSFALECKGGGRCHRLSNMAKQVDWGPVPGNAACAEIYGGDEKLLVRGYIGDSNVRSSFSRINGCEIGRWNTFEKLVRSDRLFTAMARRNSAGAL